jgi:hypothetical protein
MSYFFDLEDRASNYANNCISLTDIQENSGSIDENKDGTVSVYMPYGPIFLTKECCERLKPNSNYYFDLNTQKCRWTPILDTCGLDNIKVTLNPDGNDGTIFYTDSADEICSLIIDFDYLFKVSCESLTTIMNGSDKTSEQLNAEKKVRDIQLEITKKTADCETISKQITETNKQIDATSYSITCSQRTASASQEPTWNGQSGNFGNTGFSPFGFTKTSGSGGATLCLTDGGLSIWGSILGTDRYNSFINGDSTSYTCSDFNNIVLQNNEIVKNNTINNTNLPELFFQCTTPFGTKTRFIKVLNALNAKQTNCQSELEVLNTKLISAQNNLLLLEPLECSRPVDTFESLDISISLEVEDSFNNTRTIATYPLLTPIGAGNLYTYLTDNGDNSGLLVCGEPNAKELAKGITGCTPMHLNASKDVFACEGLLEHMTDELYVQSTLTDKKEFLKTLNNDVFASKFLHHNTIIDDQAIISQIINKKVKLSVRINHTCSDFCVLMDNIQLNKSCTLVTEKKMFIAQPPSFDLERIIDNKKSWIANTSFNNRTFSIKNEIDANPIRLTDYDVNDERLIINTKEIDLDISIASGIETDVWGYIVDNPCLLTATTEISNCCEGCCSGETSVNFSELMTQPLSAVTTIEDFEYYISSELIDVKSRKVLSGYPTLRALYDRYTNSSDYCATTSSAFDYTKMDQFAHLIDSYWVDIVEQVVPATTIWGSVKIYGNTMFDQQKFEYKKGNLFTCTDEMTCKGLDDINACLFNIINTYYVKEREGGCETGNCDDEITTFSQYDFMDDPRNMPTPSEIDSFGSLNCAQCKYTSIQSVIDSYPDNSGVEYSVFDYQYDNREQRDEFLLNYNLASGVLMYGFCYDELTTTLPNINSFKTILNPLSPQYNQTPSFPWNFYLKGVPKKINTFKPYKIYLDNFWYKTAPDGQTKMPGQILSAYTDTIQFIKAVPDIYHLPLVGKAGDVIKVGTIAGDEYWWNPEAGEWQLGDFEGFYSSTMSTKIDANLKALNEFLLATKPFTLAGNYLLLHPFKKWVMQNATPVTGKQIIETGGECLPCMYTNTIDCETTNTFCLGERNNWSNFDCNTQEPLVSYTDGRKLDFMDDLTHMPSFENLVALPYTSGTVDYSSSATLLGKANEYEDLNYFYTYRDEIDDTNPLEATIIHGMALGFDITQFPTLNYHNILDVNFDSNKLGNQYKGKIRKIKHRWWRIASWYPEWTASTYTTHNKTLKQILPNVEDFTYLKAVATSSLLPTTGNAGDLNLVGTPTSYVGYAWDPILNIWSTDFYDFIDIEILEQRFAFRAAHIKAKNELLFATKPFLFANEYSLAHGVKQWMYGDAKNFDAGNRTGSDVIYNYNNGLPLGLPPEYVVTATTHTIPSYTADTYTIIY